MADPAPGAGITIALDSIDKLFPLHLLVARDGRIVRVGPTLQRLFPPDILGAPFLTHFECQKPRHIRGFDDLLARAGSKLLISGPPRQGGVVQFRCVAVPVGRKRDQLLVDFSFGADFGNAIERFDLTTRDFKPNDSSVDLFFTFETQKTLLEDSQRLTNALSAAKEEAERKARSDTVTGIANRRALQERLDELGSIDSDGYGHALMLIDLDKFKSVNDAFGHGVGDVVLQCTAKAILKHCGPKDLAARLGGDEFALAIEGAPDPESLLERAQSLRVAIAAAVLEGDRRCKVDASIGIAPFFPLEDATSDRLLLKADIALYQAKAAPDRVEIVTEEMVARHDAETHLLSDLDRGLGNAEFVPFFQPQIDIRDGHLLGFEVLCRWVHPTRGLLAPAVFLAQAERADRMSAIDSQVMQLAVGHFAEWVGRFGDIGKLSFNLTAANLRAPNFSELLLDNLMTVGLSADVIQLELLEAILLDKSDSLLIERCTALRAAGFSLALDDFGTGHASISTLIDAPISLLKIDRSFVSGIDTDTVLQKVTRSILAMAEQIDLAVLAEGVSSQAELDTLRTMGCHLVQGYHFARPMPAEAVIQWIVEWQGTGKSRAAL